MIDDDEPLEVAVYDACVLCPYTLRDTLISLAMTKKFQARWSEKITEEWITNLLKNQPRISQEKIVRTSDLMLKAVPDAIIVGYEHLIDGLTLPDPNDRHVLAAAIHAEASKIVTDNVRHFPSDVVAKWDIEVCRPDDFIVRLLKDYQLDVLKELRLQRRRLLNPPQTVDEFLESLAKVGLKATVNTLRPLAELL